MIEDSEIIRKLGSKALELTGSSSSELERSCWMVVHEYRHDVMPVEYDIREIDEDLYLAVLKFAKSNFK